MAPSPTTAPMPIRLVSPTVQPVSTALCPMVTWEPIEVPLFSVVLITAWSWTLVPAPMATHLASPRTTAPYQTDALAPTATDPTTDAHGAMKAPSEAVGCLS
eukprot:CAMPEP_0171741430 /NCGR_PEP_ID=MMETSP0991-20121206/35554_1 /TAXON_ID=483369 /ORGANISM="non described non described, Strain CCMP2098" /LENGTH=101 /DNA_ID=CAMNT_0012339697 /DNA_START=376 /DNA_END=681 /DNA_ORIENTATION=+